MHVELSSWLWPVSLALVCVACSGGGGGPPGGTCAFDVQHQQSPVIGTVETVTFSSRDLPNPTEAHIDFGLAGAAPTMTAPVDLSEPMNRTVLVGMKGQRAYTFRIVATDGTKTCTSGDYTFTTGAIPAKAPKIEAVQTTPGVGAKGFIVTTYGLRVGGTDPLDAFIFDTDGDIVWWSPVSLDADGNGVSRSHLAWDAKAVWILAAKTGGQIVRVSMDGVTVTDYGTFLTNAHHDFAPLPDGSIAVLLASGDLYSVAEMKLDGTITTVVEDAATLYQGYHYTNALHYYPADDTYTLSDTASSLFVKFRRDGTLLWQLGGSDPLGESFTLVGLTQWSHNHGHHLTADGHFLFFNNDGLDGMSAAAWDVLLDETTHTATKTWGYRFDKAVIAFGDAERLPNGNALITYPTSPGKILELDADGNTVQSFDNTSYGFGFADFRTSLYGPPPR